MKTNLHNILGVDPILSEEGIWVDICHGVRVKIASAESRRYKLAMRNALSARADQRDNGVFKQESLQDATIEAIAEGLLLDWDGVTVDDEPLPFSVEAAKELLADKDLAVFSERIAAAAQNLAAFREEQLQAAEKN